MFRVVDYHMQLFTEEGSSLLLLPDVRIGVTLYELGSCRWMEVSEAHVEHWIIGNKGTALAIC